MPTKFFSELTQQTGPAFIGREPLILPEQRKRLVNNVKQQMNNE